ncbi:MAG: hypothetical protein H0X04_08895, partial [Chthoniobacterales bacterium]|nr:hypothetical protein [Chthoniobacterales bacterium]
MKGLRATTRKVEGNSGQTSGEAILNLVQTWDSAGSFEEIRILQMLAKLSDGSGALLVSKRLRDLAFC